MSETKNIGQIPLLPLTASIVVTDKNALPCIELRKITTKQEVIKHIISCAFHEVPIIIYPKFKDKLKAITSLIEKGILYYDKDQNQYFFNF